MNVVIKPGGSLINPKLLHREARYIIENSHKALQSSRRGEDFMKRITGELSPLKQPIFQTKEQHTMAGQSLNRQ